MAVKFTTMDRAQQCEKMRIHAWINIETGEPQFSIEANVAYGKWAHVLGFDKQPLFFAKKVDAKDGIRRIKDEAGLAR